MSFYNIIGNIVANILFVACIPTLVVKLFVFAYTYDKYIPIAE